MIWWLEKRDDMVLWCLYEPLLLSNGKTGWDLVMVDYVEPDRDLLCFEEDLTGTIVGVTVDPERRF